MTYLLRQTHAVVRYQLDCEKYIVVQVLMYSGYQSVIKILASQ